MVVSRDDNLIITQNAAPKNACGRGTGNKYIISHGLTTAITNMYVHQQCTEGWAEVMMERVNLNSN